MAPKPGSFKQQKVLSSVLINGALIVICLLWIVPTIGVLVTSFRNSQNIFTTGWWTALPHRGYAQSSEIKLDSSVDVNGPHQNRRDYLYI